jgi:hypothetical protein
MTTTARFLVMWETPRDSEAFERHYRATYTFLWLGRPRGSGATR